jgi:hypothetical protein
MTEKELKDLGKQLKEYCDRYLISTNYLFEILNDQKVTPMIRGKATEYEVYLLLKSHLNKSEWSVQKLNLLPSPGLSDEDISVTHLRTGKVLKVESKNAVRGSISNGLRSRIHNVPHFKVKCHRSRSNIKLAGSSNDRYAVNEFDIIITNPLNALIRGKTIGPELEIITEKIITKILYKHYIVSNAKELLNAANKDWRFVVPSEIADDSGFIPRTPYVLLKDDPNWLLIDKIENKLIKIIKKMPRKQLRY